MMRPLPCGCRRCVMRCQRCMMLLRRVVVEAFWLAVLVVPSCWLIWQIGRAVA